MEGFLVFLFLVFLDDDDGNFFLLLIVIRGLGADGRFCPNIVSDNLPLRPGDPYHIVVLPSSLSSSSSSLSSLSSLGRGILIPYHIVLQSSSLSSFHSCFNIV